MNMILNTFPKLSLPVDRISSLQLFQGISIRHASKKASGGNKNGKQASGKGRSWKKLDGSHVFPGDILATQNKMNWLPGLNVAMKGRLNLAALKEGHVVVTCEVPDLDYDHSWSRTFFTAQKGQIFFKKYFHVIPMPQHNRFKLIDQI